MTDLCVHRFGLSDGPDLVLLHGLTEAGTAWPDAVRRWQGTWRIHALDLRGHGHSPRFTDEELGRIEATFEADVVELLGSLPGPAVVVGHSLGARVGLAVALAHPELVRRVVLEDPPLDVGGEPEDDDDFVAEQQRFLDTFLHGIAPEVVRMRGATAWTLAEILEWAACKPLVDRRMIERMSLADFPATTALNSLTVPTLVVVDADGPLAPDPAEITNPLVRVEPIDDVGHCVRRDDPVTFHRLVDRFLAEQPRP